MRHKGSAPVRRCSLVKILPRSLIGQIFSAVQNSQHCAKMRIFLSPLFFPVRRNTRTRVRNQPYNECIVLVLGLMYADLFNIISNFQYYRSCPQACHQKKDNKSPVFYMKRTLKTKGSTFYLLPRVQSAICRIKNCIVSALFLVNRQSCIQVEPHASF